MNFEFGTATRIVFGPGKLAELPSLLEEFGKRAFLITGKASSRAAGLKDGLRIKGFSMQELQVAGEPTVKIVRRGAQMAQGCDFVVGFGGGSAMDAAKAVAAVAAGSGEPMDYLELVGKGLAIEQAPLPFIAIPTTAGTGAEVTRNAVLESEEYNVKASIRSPKMLARIALIDPELTFDMPPGLTATTGMDALTQLIEAYVSCRANALTDLFCSEGLQGARWALPAAFRDPGSKDARASMSMASLLSGLALANAGLGAVHGFAAPLGAMLHAPHGAICAALLSEVLETNIRAVRERGTGEQIDRFRKLAAMLTGNGSPEPESAVIWINTLAAALQIQPLGSLGLQSRQIPEAVKRAAEASSMRGNPLPLKESELTNILKKVI